MRKSQLLLTVIGLRYETTTDQLRVVLVELRKMLIGHPRATDAEPSVRFMEFGDYSLNVEIRVDIDVVNLFVFRSIREDILLRAMDIIKQAGTSVAFPSQTVYYSSDGGINEELRDLAGERVRKWRENEEFPFPTFSSEYRNTERDTLDYPPEGSVDRRKKQTGGSAEKS